MRTRTTTGTARRVAALLAVGVLAVGVLGLSGCAPANAYPRISEALATPREAEDALPSFAAELGLDAESSRLVGTVGHVDYYVATAAAPDGDETYACLVLAATGAENAMSSCSPSEAGMYSYGAGLGSARVSADTTQYPASDGWVPLAGFLLVKPSGTPAA
jgi:hypothetical protein